MDDEKEIVTIQNRFLSGLGYRVIVFTSSVEALKHFKEHPEMFHLVITDMTMPGMTGAELAREILEIRPDIPIVLCTGFSELINEEKAKAMGIRQFVMKPVNMAELAGVVRKMLD